MKRKDRPPPSPPPPGWTPEKDIVIRPCSACGADDFWRSKAGRLVCRQCHPPAPGVEDTATTKGAP